MYRNVALEQGGWHVQTLRVAATGRTYKFWVDVDRIDAAHDDLAGEAAAENRANDPATQQAMPF